MRFRGTGRRAARRFRVTRAIRVRRALVNGQVGRNTRRLCRQSRVTSSVARNLLDRVFGARVLRDQAPGRLDSARSVHVDERDGRLGEIRRGTRCLRAAVQIDTSGVIVFRDSSDLRLIVYGS